MQLHVVPSIRNCYLNGSTQFWPHLRVHHPVCFAYRSAQAAKLYLCRSSLFKCTSDQKKPPVPIMWMCNSCALSQILNSLYVCQTEAKNVFAPSSDPSVYFCCLSRRKTNSNSDFLFSPALILIYSVMSSTVWFLKQSCDDCRCFWNWWLASITDAKMSARHILDKLSPWEEAADIYKWKKVRIYTVEC